MYVVIISQSELVTQSCPTLCDPMDCNPPDFSVQLSRQEYWSGLLFASQGDLPDPGIKPGSPEIQADSLLSEPPGKPYTEIISTKMVNYPQTHQLQR